MGVEGRPFRLEEDCIVTQWPPHWGRMRPEFLGSITIWGPSQPQSWGHVVFKTSGENRALVEACPAHYARAREIWEVLENCFFRGPPPEKGPKEEAVERLCTHIGLLGNTIKRRVLFAIRLNKFRKQL